MYGDVNGDEDFDLKDISCLFRNVGCDYRDSWDFFPDGLISLKDVASLFYDYLDLHGA